MPSSSRPTPSPAPSRATLRYTILAIVVIAIWGSTFASTKVVLQHGLSPIGVYFFRFLLSYLLLLPFCPRPWCARSWRDELLLFATGLCGGTLFYALQNYALTLTQTTNVSFLICTNPLLTILLVLLIGRGEESVTRHLLLGIVVALSGVGLVIFSGAGQLQLSLMGDLLALGAALSWALYTVLVRPLSGRYPVDFISRKIFFYGALTGLPLFLLGLPGADVAALAHPLVWSNVLYLTLLASIVCYLLWNKVIEQLGAVRSAAFIYLDPLFATLYSLVLLRERMTVHLALGLLLILVGVFVAQGLYRHHR